MDPTDIGLFGLAERRLAWVDERQRLLAQNIANANTPGFVPRDVAPFAAAMALSGLVQTSPLHLAGKGGGKGSLAASGKARSLSGNTVSVEEQLGRVADTAGVHELVLNLHHKYQAMMRTALGRGS